MLTIIIVEVIERLLVYNIQADNLEFGKQSIHIGLCWHVFCSPSRLPHITARDVKFLKQSWPLDWGKAYWEQLLNSQVVSPSLPHPWWLHVLSTLWSKVNPRSCLFERDLPICQQLALFSPWMSGWAQGLEVMGGGTLAGCSLRWEKQRAWFPQQPPDWRRLLAKSAGQAAEEHANIVHL